MRKRGLQDIESEIRKEKAEALGRAGERLERALQDLETFRQEISGVIAAKLESIDLGEERFPPEVEKILAEYARLRERARELRHSLIIQREAVGLWRHEDVDRQYPLPDCLTLANARDPEGGR